ncbi:MAG: hypothetical protein EPO32_04170 [Anaerolineae bacterium]|nr:MAG: hypothetical protein EPO32_04170 [Anaerolineae bacterium]
MKARQVTGTLFLLLVLLASTVQVAFATTAMFKIYNKTGGQITITLTGPKIYAILLKFGASNVEVERGTYNYSYYACGKTFTGTVVVKPSSSTLELPKCPVTAAAATGSTAGTNTIQVRINNRTGVKLWITLRGPATYTLEMLSGLNKILVAKGTYTYSYEACGKTNTGTFKATSPNVELKLPPCTVVGSDGEKAQTLRLKIQNDTGANMTLYLYGPANYTFTITPGVNQVYVVKGTYTYYNYTACGYTSGTIVVKPQQVWRWWCNN